MKVIYYLLFVYIFFLNSMKAQTIGLMDSRQVAWTQSKVKSENMYNFGVYAERVLNFGYAHYSLQYESVPSFN